MMREVKFALCRLRHWLSGYVFWLCRGCLIVGGLFVIAGALRGDLVALIIGGLTVSSALSGRALLCALETAQVVQGAPTREETALVAAVALLRASEVPGLNPLDCHYRRAAAEQEIIAAAEELIKERGWS